MIQPNELRKGNKVLYNGNIQTVVGYCSEYVYLDCITADYVTFEEIFPIEITEEILLENGFNVMFFNEFNCCYTKHNIDYHFPKHSANKFVKIGKMTYEKNYLHQLQNLYYSITNKEL